MPQLPLVVLLFLFRALVCRAALQEEHQECRGNDGDCSGDESNLLQHRLQSTVKSGRQPLRWDALEGLQAGESLDVVEQRISQRFEEIKRHHEEGQSIRTSRDMKKSAAFFEMCKPGDAAKRRSSVMQEESRTRTYACQIPACDLTTHMVLEEDTATGVVQTCCPLSETYCAGCARANATACEVCIGGYTMVNGICTACIDTVGWTGYDNTTCWTATCNDTKVDGISSSDACCSCGGGEQAATPFQYRASTVLLGSNFVSGGPVPRTATRYSLDDSCELVKYGLTIDGSTGALMRAADSTQSSGLADMGWKPFDVTCTITAHQTADLNHSTTLSVSANWFSYETFNNAGVLIGSNLQPANGLHASLLGINGTTVAQALPCHRRGLGHGRHHHAKQTHDEATSGALGSAGLSTPAVAGAAGPAVGEYSGTEIPLENFGFMCYGNGNKPKSLCEFQLKCATADTTKWITISSDNGDLTPVPLPPPSAQPGVTGFGSWNGQAGNPGGKCEVTARRSTVGGFPGFPPGRTVREIKFSFPVVAPKIWPSFSYATTELHATVGESAPPLYVTAPEASDASKTEYAKPARFSIACDEFPAQIDGRTSFQFDTVTGTGTVNGQDAFTLDVTTGAVRASPSPDVVHALDGLDSSQLRRELQLTCAVIAHYDDIEIGTPTPWVASPLNISLRDDTCWLSVTAKFLVNSTTYPHQTVSATSEADCRTQCRSDVVCTHYLWNAAETSCTFNHFRCSSDANAADCDELVVEEKIKHCSELASCLKLEFGHHWDLSGWYCPKGDMMFEGVAYERTSVTAEDTLWLAPYDPERETVDGCSAGDWLLRKPDSAKDFLESSKDIAELNGQVIACFSAGGDLTSLTLADGVVTLNITATPSDTALLPVLKANVAESRIENQNCPAPNMTEMLAEAESEAADDPQSSSQVVAIVLDDPTTSTPADHWLHPCSCFSPTNWGSEAPVTSESFEDIAAGSDNQYTPNPFVIVDGEFTCEPGPLSLIKIMVYQDEDTDDFDAVCQQKCRSDADCLYYFSGTAESTKQCRLYKQCTVLTREVGIAGKLYGMTSKLPKVCRIANPSLCSQVSLRREFLGAAIDSSTELNPSPRAQLMYRDLTDQCDYKNMNGQMGINSCGLASYSFQSPDFWLGKTPPPSGRASGYQLIASCWDERYHPVPDLGTGPMDLGRGATTLTCLSGQWVGANGQPGLSGFACASCVTVAKAPYGTLQKQTQEELYFTPNKELNLYVMTVPPQKVDSSGNLVVSPLILVNDTADERAVPPFLYGTLSNTWTTSNVDLNYCVGIEKNRKIGITSSSLSITFDVTITGPGILDGFESTSKISAYGAWSGGAVGSRSFVSVNTSNEVYVDVGSYSVSTLENASATEAQNIAYGIAFANYAGLAREAGPWEQNAAVQGLVYKVTINGTDYQNSVTNDLNGLAFGVHSFPQSNSFDFDWTNGTVTVTLTVDYSFSPVQEDVLRMMDCKTQTSSLEPINLGWVYGNATNPGPNLQVDGGSKAGQCVSRLDVSAYVGSDMLTVTACSNTSSWQKWEYLVPDDVSNIFNKLRLVEQAANTYCLTTEGDRPGDWPLYLESCVDDNNDQRADGALVRGIYTYDFAQDQWNMEQQDCWANVQTDVACTATCGGGFSQRTVTVLSENTGLGQTCPAAVVQCNMFACTEGGSGGYLPELFSGASVGYKQFRSTGSLTSCLTFNASGQAELAVAPCDVLDMNQQIDTAQIPTMLWDVVRKSVAGGNQIAQVASVAKFSTVQQRMFLSDLSLTQNCGDDAVVQEIRWGTRDGKPGFLVRCAAAVINTFSTQAIATVSQLFKRSDLIQTKDGGYCLSATYNDLPHSGLTDSEKNSLKRKTMALVQLLKCDHTDKSQHFYWSSFKIRSNFTDLCMQPSTGTTKQYLRLVKCWRTSFKWEYDQYYQLRSNTSTSSTDSDRSDDYHCINWMKAVSGSDTQQKVAVTLPCVSSSSNPVGVKQGQTEYSQGLWNFGSGILGLNDLQISCDPLTGSVLNYVSMSTTRMAWRCVPLGALGQCQRQRTAEVDTISANLNSLPGLSMNCSEGALMSFTPELSSGGDTIKYKYTCCDLTEPSALVLTGVDYTADIETDQGVFCANESRDESDRLYYHQQSWFNQSDSTPHVLAFDHLEGEWCVSDGTTSSCVANDNAVPTDTALENNDWQAVPVTDFTYSPTPRGTAGSKKKIRKFPELITFKAVQPQYAEECQDDVTPGNTGFDRDLMRKMYTQLPPENPCSLIGGLSAEESEDKEAKGLSYLIGKSAYGVDDRETGYGITYKDAYDCSGRAISRADTVWKTDMGFEVADQARESISQVLSMVCDAFPPPGLWAGFMGGGEAEWDVSKACSNGVQFALMAWKNTQGLVHMGLQNSSENIERNDCDPIQVGFARAACDMHCIRNAVREGTKAILKSMENAVSTQTTNNNLMLEYYSGLVLDKMDEQYGTGAGLLQEDVRREFKSAQQMSNAFFLEMKGLLRESKLDTRGEHALARALTSFMAQESQLLTRNTNRSKEDAGDFKQELASMVQRAKRLHAVVKGAAAKRLSKKDMVERRMHAFTVQHQDVLKAYNKRISGHKARAAATKHLQQVLMGNLRPSLVDLAVQLELQHVEAIMVDIDSTWWELRQVFDVALEAADDHISAMQHSTSLMQEYTSMCALPYDDFLASFRQSWAITEKAKSTVKDSWKKAVPLLGLLASKLVDSNALVHFARADMLMMDAKKVILGEDRRSQNVSHPGDVALLERNRASLCSKTLSAEVKEAVKSVLHTAAFGPGGTLGIWGSTVHQAKVVLADIGALEHWHEPLALGRAPDRDDVEIAAGRLQNSLDVARRAQDAMVEDALNVFLASHCQ